MTATFQAVSGGWADLSHHVLKELNKAKSADKRVRAALFDLMERCVAGSAVIPKDVKYLRSHDLWELRLDGPSKTTFRLYFCVRDDVLIALAFSAKKSQKDNDAMDKARRRMRDL